MGVYALLRRVLLATLLALLANYLYFYNTMDLREAFFAADHTISNSYGRTYQTLFARTFYPSDIGLLGVMFKYGFVGLCLYL